MKVQEIKNIILAKTQLSVTKAHQKALRVTLNQITLESVIGKEEKAAPKAASKQQVYIPRGFFYTLGMEETTVSRKVTDITEKEFTTYGKVKIAKKTLEVYKTDNNEWTLV